MDARSLVWAITQAGYKPRSYSEGRASQLVVGPCVAFEVERIADLAPAGVSIAARLEDEEDRYDLRRLSILTDALGPGYIVFFPNVGWEQAK